MRAASPYCLYAEAFCLMLSASALPIASIELASAAPINLIRSASARAASTVCVLKASFHYTSTRTKVALLFRAWCSENLDLGE